MNEPTDAAEVPEPEPEPVAARRHRDLADDEDDPRKRLKLLVPLVMAAAAIVGLVLFVIESKGTYSRPVDQLVAQQGSFVGKPVRVDGKLVHGTLGMGPSGCDYRFTIASNKAEVPVRFPQCVVPDSLRDVPGIEVEVGVEGALQADGSFVATRVFTKCPSRYEEDRLMAQGAKRPH